MKKMYYVKKVITLLAVAVMAVSAAACGSQNGESASNADAGTGEETANVNETGKEAEAPDTVFKVAYVNLADSDVNCRITKEYFEEYVKEYQNLEVSYYDSESDLDKMINNMETAIASAANAIVVLPLDASALAPVANDAAAAGIHVIAFRGTIESDQTAYVGSENIESGELQGEYLAEVLPENAKVLYMTGTAGMSVTIDRQEGLHNALEEAGRTDVEFLAEKDADFDKAEGMKLMEDWIQTFPEVDAVVAANDQMALGAMEALKAAGKLDGVIIVGVDGVEEAVNAIENGEMTMTAFQNCDAQAKACAEQLDKLSRGEEISNVLVPYEVVTAENAADYK